MSKTPFHSSQFAPTKGDSAEAKARWANTMASWIKRGFPESGWRRNLYIPLSMHMYGHIAHYNRHGFYAEWFDGVYRQLEWLKYAARGGLFGSTTGHPAYTWSDVE